MWQWLLDTFRSNPAIPIFLTLGLGFWIGKFKYKSFSLGTVTSVLLVGVAVGQMDIPISGPLKDVSFLLFLFAIGYSVGPQFFRAMRGSGVRQVLFAVLMCVMCMAVTLGVCWIFGYNKGEAAGLFAGAQTISAVIGVGGDTISNLGLSQADKTSMVNIIPVCYAVTYIFGTIGSAYILSFIGPMMLGGIKKVRQQTAELEAQMDSTSDSDDPAFFNALRPVVFRAYKVSGDWFASGDKTVADIEGRFHDEKVRGLVERLRQADGTILTAPAADTVVKSGDTIVLSGRREYILTDTSWIGPEVADSQLLSFEVEKMPVLVAKKDIDGMTVAQLLNQPYMHGVFLAAIIRDGKEIPVLSQTEIMRGDTLRLSGLQKDLTTATARIGYGDKASTATNMIFVGLGVFIGALIGAITIHCGGIPISLSTSGGALIAGLVMGWWRSRRPSVAGIPSQSVWLLNNLGLNLFIAVVGISSAPTFVSGIAQVGPMLFVAGIIATTVPLILGIWIGDKVFHFPPAINLGCNAGSRVTTASLGAIQDALGSTVPAMGYTITYAVANTLLILMGVAITLIV